MPTSALSSRQCCLGVRSYSHSQNPVQVLYAHRSLNIVCVHVCVCICACVCAYVWVGLMPSTGPRYNLYPPSSTLLPGPDKSIFLGKASPKLDILNLNNSGRLWNRCHCHQVPCMKTEVVVVFYRSQNGFFPSSRPFHWNGFHQAGTLIPDPFWLSPHPFFLCRQLKCHLSSPRSLRWSSSSAALLLVSIQTILILFQTRQGVSCTLSLCTPG